MYHELRQDPLWDDIGIFSLTYDQYMSFSSRYVTGKVSAGPPPGPPAASTSYSQDPVAQFAKSIKRESRDFPFIKDIQQWDRGKRAWMATATVQSVQEVMDPTFVPAAADKALFDLKNGYVYKVAVDNLLEPSLWVIVNEGPVGDGQAVWRNVLAEAGKGTRRLASPHRRSVRTSPL
jgi:hypothetical protein